MIDCAKFRVLTILIVLIGLVTACQQEPQQLPVRKLTNSVWHKKNKKQKDLHYEGPHNFFEYHHRIRTRSGDVSPRYTTNYKQAALQKALRQRKANGVARNEPLDWQERGPGNVGGRTRGILIDQRDETHLTWFVGSAGGGIWKTTDGGQNFELKTEELPNMSTTTIAASEADPLIIYAGTGEGFDGQMIKGDGIYKSIDGGENWALIPATGNNPQFDNVLRLVVDPADPNIVLAATRKGFNVAADESGNPITNGYIMKSIDGGNSWNTVYTLSLIHI